MGAPKNKGYKRSWKNLLLNVRYQLRFTLFMVAICAVLMAVLGWWVLRAADKATTVAMDNVLGVSCQKPEPPGRGSPQVIIDEGTDDIDAPDDGASDGDEAGAPDPDDAPDDAEAPEEAKAPPADEAEPPDGDAPAPPDPGAAPVPADDRVIVDIVEEDVPLPQVSDEELAAYHAATARYHMCRAQQASTIQRLRANRDRIIYVLVGAGLALCIGLAFYGIKMTHKVAGPLHKVGLYFAKMRDGKYDTVYNLRKGDQLVSFYEHFKEAHEGMRTVETRDVEQLRELIAAADAAKVGDQSAEVKEALDELRKVLSRKEDAIG